MRQTTDFTDGTDFLNSAKFACCSFSSVKSVESVVLFVQPLQKRKKPAAGQSSGNGLIEIPVTDQAPLIPLNSTGVIISEVLAQFQVRAGQTFLSAKRFPHASRQGCEMVAGG